MTTIKDALSGQIGALALAVRCRLGEPGRPPIDPDGIRAAFDEVRPMIERAGYGFHAVAVGIAGAAILMVIDELLRQGLPITADQVTELMQRLPPKVVEEGEFDMAAMLPGGRH